MSTAEPAGDGRVALARRREAAGAHFRRLGEAHVDTGGGNSAASIAPETSAAGSGRFEIYRTDEIRVTATRFAGGDWHWRLSDAGGGLLVDAGGYGTEEDCRTAVASLRKEASRATMPAGA